MSLLVACNADPSPTFLEGVWRSDRELTLANLPNDLDPERRQYLEQNLGRLRISFRGDQIRALFDNDNEMDVEADGFRIKKLEPGYVELEIYYSLINYEKVTYHMLDKCFYLAQPQWGYNEYFCRIDGSVEPPEGPK